MPATIPWGGFLYAKATNSLTGAWIAQLERRKDTATTKNFGTGITATRLWAYNGLAISGRRGGPLARSNLIADLLRGKPFARLSVFIAWLCGMAREKYGKSQVVSERRLEAYGSEDETYRIDFKQRLNADKMAANDLHCERKAYQQPQRMLATTRIPDFCLPAAREVVFNLRKILSKEAINPYRWPHTYHWR